MSNFVSSDPQSIRNAEQSLFKLGEAFRLAGGNVGQNPEIGRAASEIAAARLRTSTKPAHNDTSNAFTGLNNTLSM